MIIAMLDGGTQVLSFSFNHYLLEPGYLDLQFNIIFVVTEFFGHLGPAFFSRGLEYKMCSDTLLRF